MPKRNTKSAQTHACLPGPTQPPMPNSMQIEPLIRQFLAEMHSIIQQEKADAWDEGRRTMRVPVACNPYLTETK